MNWDQIFAYAIFIFMLYSVGKLWINDMKHLTIKRAIIPIISLCLGILFYRHKKWFIIAMCVIMILMLTIPSLSKWTLEFMQIMVVVLNGMILKFSFEQISKHMALKGIVVILSLFVLHLQIFPENWESCYKGYYRKHNLCYKPNLG